MNEDALRALIRETVARQMTGAASARHATSAALAFVGHPSQYRYTLPEPDGPCIIEPGVPCNHCGYCQSHGH